MRAARHDGWVEVRSPNFIVVSNAGERQARKTAIQFEQIHTLFRDGLAVAQGHPSPVITIFALKDEKSLGELLPDYWTKGHMHPSGVFAFGLHQYYAAVNLEAQGTNPFATMYHEYYHSLTMPYFPDLPVWLSEGLADFFGESEVNGSVATMGVADPALIEELRHNRLIPLDVLFHVDSSSPYYNEQNKVSVFYAESWALTHYLMIGDKQSHRRMLTDYANALSSGLTPDQAAAKAFGDLKKLQDDLSRYISKFTFSYFQMKAPAEPAPADLHIRELTDAEEEAYRGGFFAIRRRPEAKQILRNAVNLDPKVALAHQNLGIEEYLEGNRDSALTSISEAVRLDPQDGFARYLRAHLTFFGAGGFPQDAQIEEDLRQSVALKSDFAPANALLGLYLSSHRQNAEEALAYAKKAVNLEPGNTDFIYDLAQVLAQIQRFDEAQYVAERARANTQNAEYRARLDQFIAYLQNARSVASRNAQLQSPPAKAPPVPDSAPRPPVAQEESPKEADNSREVTGMVTQESCAAGLKLQVAAGAEVFTFHLPPGAHSAIRMMAKPAPDFDICKSLKGTQVAVRFLPDEAKKNTGAIEQLTILAAGTPAPLTIPKPDFAATSSKPLRLPAGANSAQNASVTLSGRVTAVACDKNEMSLTLLVRDSEFELHARDYARVHFDQSVPFDAGEFQPCVQLKDHDATIEYIITEKEEYDGEIQSVQVGK
ncbi:MAG TPA: tetratricopeptide repeat protein [Candidatus Acidoferrales bacterium]|nr:tetratricopeptide repeat protein [Candidatus Acidoferrales bacterium]